MWGCKKNLKNASKILNIPYRFRDNFLVCSNLNLGDPETFLIFKWFVKIDQNIGTSKTMSV